MGYGGLLLSGCKDDHGLAEVGPQGVVARHVGFQLTPLVEILEPGDGALQTVLGDQRPDRVAVPPLLGEGTAGVEVGFALDGSIDRRKPSPIGEAAVGENFGQLVEWDVACTQGVGCLRYEAVLPASGAR